MRVFNCGGQARNRTEPPTRGWFIRYLIAESSRSLKRPKYEFLIRALTNDYPGTHKPGHKNFRAKSNPMKVVASGEGEPIAVLNRNETGFHCVPVAAYEVLMEKLDDAELLQLVRSGNNELAVPITLDEL